MVRNTLYSSCFSNLYPMPNTVLIKSLASSFCGVFEYGYRLYGCHRKIVSPDEFQSSERVKTFPRWSTKVISRSYSFELIRRLPRLFHQSFARNDHNIFKPDLIHFFRFPFVHMMGLFQTPKDRAYSRDNFAQIKRLCNIVIGPEFQPQYFIRDI